MLGDTAVAVHPEDERYAHLVGREIELPLTGRRIPVVADEHVDPEFGTGAVKVTPAHDPNDFEIGRRHTCRPHVMDERGVITAPARSRGWTVRGAPADRRGAARAGPHRRGEAPVRSRCRPLLALQDGGRAAGVAAVVREGRVRWPAAGDAVRDGRVTITRRRWRTATSTGSTTCRTGASPPALVGPPHPGLVRARTARPSAPARTRSRRPGLDAGQRRARHVVLVGAVAVLHAGLARADRRTSSSTTRRPCWSPATTSSSSGSPG